MKFTIETDNPTEAAALIEHIVSRTGRNVAPAAPSPGMNNPAPSAPAAPAPPSSAPPKAPAPAPAPSAPQAPPSAAPPASPPPMAPAPASTLTAKQVLDAMGTWKQAGNGVEGVKRVLAKCNITKVPDASPEQLTWLYQVFTNQITA